MSAILFTSLLFATSLFAGLLGALTGLGGGVVIVPVLALLFHVDLRYAIGASLVSVIATSSGAAAAYVRDGLSNIRIGMFLEVATTLGALLGAFLTAHVSNHSIAILFGLVLLYSAYASLRKDPAADPNRKPDALAARLRLTGFCPEDTGPERLPEGQSSSSEGQVNSSRGQVYAAPGQVYAARDVPLGFSIMFGAGTLSGLLGIGSGAVKVLAMDQAMKLPFKVSTTTSNFMIGVTATASAGVYLAHGYIDAGLAMPVTLGVLIGSLAGSKLLVRVPTSTLKAVFAVVIVALGAEMIYSGISGKI